MKRGSTVKEKLITIQKREKLNSIYIEDEKGNGGANHKYSITLDRGLQATNIVEINFQNGARNVEGSVDGVLDTDLLEIVRHRLQCFQAGKYATRENEMALSHIEEALMWLNMRVENRIERNVLGINKI